MSRKPEESRRPAPSLSLPVSAQALPSPQYHTPLAMARRAPSWSAGHGSPAVAEEALFTTPSDLLCPITHELFLDPCINAAGQVYERRAIEQSMEASMVDPVSRERLASTALTPVYVLRSRSLEYRQSTARECMEAASSVNCPDPVRYLRRAVDLAGGGAVSVVGLSRDCCAYVSTHPSNAYDDLALQAFARGLLRAGLRDRAANVYCGLLQASVDRAQQIELLQACLACWTPEDSGEPDDSTFRQLAIFVESQASFTWGRAVDTLLEAGLGTRFCLALCEQLLQQRSGDGAAAGDKGASGEEGGAAEPPADWAKQRSVLLKYLQLVRASIEERQVALERRVDAVQEAQQQGLADASAGSEAGSSSCSGEGTAPGGCSAGKGPFAGSRVAWWRGRVPQGERLPPWLRSARTLGSAAAVLAQLALRSNTLPARLVKLAPVLFLLNARH